MLFSFKDIFIYIYVYIYIQLIDSFTNIPYCMQLQYRFYNRLAKMYIEYHTIIYYFL